MIRFRYFILGSTWKLSFSICVKNTGMPGDGGQNAFDMYDISKVQYFRYIDLSKVLYSDTWKLFIRYPSLRLTPCWGLRRKLLPAKKRRSLYNSGHTKQPGLPAYRRVCVRTAIPVYVRSGKACTRIMMLGMPPAGSW